MAGPAHARPLTNDEVRVLQNGGSHGQALVDAVQLAKKLGSENNLDALPVLVRLRSTHPLLAFSVAFNAPTSPQLEELVLSYLNDPGSQVADIIAQMLHKYQSREVFEALYRRARQDLIDSKGIKPEERYEIPVFMEKLTDTEQQGIEEPLAQLLPLASDGREVQNIVEYLDKQSYLPALGRLVGLYKKTRCGQSVFITYALESLRTTQVVPILQRRLDMLVAPECVDPSSFRSYAEDRRKNEIESIVYFLTEFGEDWRPKPMLTLDEMDRIKGTLSNAGLDPKVSHVTEAYLTEYERKVSTFEAKLASRAPLPGPWSLARCEATRSEFYVESDGPEAYANSTRQEIREARAKHKGVELYNPAYCFGLMSGHNEVLDACIKYPIDFNKPCSSGSPVVYAAERSNQSALSTLILHGTNVEVSANSYDPHGTNLLGHVVLMCANQPLETCQQFLKVLVNHGANVNGPVAANETPIEIAARSGNKKLISLLLSLGADINGKNREGGNALDVVELSKNREMANFLRAHGGKANYAYQMKARVEASVMGAAFFLTCLTTGCEMH